MSTTDVIRIDGIRAFGHHGVLPAERLDGQIFIVDIELRLDLREAARTDDLEHTVDYSTVTALALDVITGEARNLIETVAERIAQGCLLHSVVQSVVVTVHKPNAPIEADFGDVSVRLERRR